MKSSENELHELPKCGLETIQASTLEPLNENQKEKLDQIISIVSKHLSYTDEGRVTLTFRGVNRDHLTSKLSSKVTSLSDEKLFSLLFYFGDKAKQYYISEDTKASGLRWLQKIEDFSQETYSTIFEKIRYVLKSEKREVRTFCKQNKEFADFFLNDNNRSIFISSLIEETNFGRDYYLYFLHTAGEIGIRNNKSIFVSTSLSFDLAVKFSGNSGEGYVIYYIIPEPFENFAISYKRVQSYEPWLTAQSLPIYNGEALYPEQYEVAIKGALFSSFILGVRVIEKNRFIVNPYLFQEPNAIESILIGLYIDQTDFIKRLGETGYRRGVGIYLEGTYRTILRESAVL